MCHARPRTEALSRQPLSLRRRCRLVISPCRWGHLRLRHAERNEVLDERSGVEACTQMYGSGAPATHLPPHLSVNDLGHGRRVSQKPAHPFPVATAGCPPFPPPASGSEFRGGGSAAGRDGGGSALPGVEPTIRPVPPRRPVSGRHMPSRQTPRGRLQPLLRNTCGARRNVECRPRGFPSRYRVRRRGGPRNR